MDFESVNGEAGAVCGNKYRRILRPRLIYLECQPPTAIYIYYAKITKYELWILYKIHIFFEIFEFFDFSKQIIKKIKQNNKLKSFLENILVFLGCFVQ